MHPYPHIRPAFSHRIPTVASVILMLLWVGCAGKKPPVHPPGNTRPYQIDGKWYHPIPKASGFKEKGIASWYGDKFHGRRTSSGEVYDMYAMTAAHKTLPFGTVVRVRNLDNGNQIEVRINDRGPFVGGRIIDLSYEAARKIGLVGPGTAAVSIRALKSGRSAAGRRPRPAAEATMGTFTFQIGAFANRESAEQQRRLLAMKYRNVTIKPYETGKGPLYRVRVGRFTSLKQAKAQQMALVQDGYTDVMIVAE